MRLWKIVLTSLTLGVLVIIALYHVLLYVQRRQDPLPVVLRGFLSLVCDAGVSDERFGGTFRVATFPIVV